MTATKPVTRTRANVHTETDFSFVTSQKITLHLNCDGLSSVENVTNARKISTSYAEATTVLGWSADSRA